MSVPHQAGPAEAVRTLGVFAHPDDETLSGGAILATMARRGEVTVVSANRGEHGEVIGADLAHLEGDYEALGRYRAGEIAGALAALGVRHHAFLDQLPGLAGHRPERITDSGMQWPQGHTGVRAEPADDVGPDAFSQVPLEVTARLVAGLIRRIRPHLVLTEEPDGGYGHPDHVQANRVTMRAVELAGQEPLEPLAPDDPVTTAPPWRVPVVAWVVRPEGRARPAIAWLDGHEQRPTISAHTGGRVGVLDGQGGLPTIIRPDDQVDLDVPLEPAVLDALAGAMRAHGTQIQLSHVDPGFVAESGGHAAGWFGLSNDLLQPVPARATAQLAPGWGEPEALRALVTGPVIPAPGHRSETATGTPAEEDEEPGWYRGLMLALTAALAILAAMVGSVFHRWQPPFGLMIALLAVLCAGVLARTLTQRRGHVLYVAVLTVVVLAMTYLGQGDTLVTGQPIGVGWLIGAPAFAALAALAPQRWFRD